MDKFSRNYSLFVQGADRTTLSLTLPFTIEFDITRNILSSANVAQIRIYNLSKKNRNNLRFDISNYGEFRGVLLKAGYGANLPTIFSGNIFTAWSVREGNNFISQIECFDGGYALANGIYNKSFISDTPEKSVLESMTQNLPQVSAGVMGNIEGNISRGNSYAGNTAELLNQLAPNKFFIDNQKAHILADDECLKGEISIINSEMGLLGTPVREETIIHFEMLFEPRLAIAQQINLESITDDNFNGAYKVISIKHKGVISGAVSGNATTTVGLMKGSGPLRVVGNV